MIESAGTFRYNQIPGKVFTKENPVILELGCNNGKNQLASKYRKYFVQPNYLGIDIVERSELNTINEDVLEYDYPENTFDLILAFEIIEHIPLRDWDGLIDVMKDSVKPGGIIVVTTPYMERLEDTVQANKNKTYYQKHIVPGINEKVLLDYFPGAEFKRLNGWKFRKRFWKGFYDRGIMTIWRREE